MPNHRWPLSPVLPFLAAAAIGIIWQPNLPAQTATHWNGTTGNWTTAASWSGGVVPNNGMPVGSTYDAYLDAAGTYTVTLNTSETVSDLFLNATGATLSISTGGTLNIVSNATLTAGTINMTGGTIAGGTLTSSGGTLTLNNNTANTLSNVQIGANVLSMSTSGSALQLTNSTNFSALSTFTMGGNSVLRVAEAVTLANLNLTLSGTSSSLQLYGGNAVTLASTVTVTSTGNNNNNVGMSIDYGENGINALTNQGTLQATAANTILNINPTGIFTNAVGGQVIASGGGTVNIATANWVNNGTYVVNAGTLNLTAGFTTASIGTITRTGGTISLQAILTNTSAALDVQTFGGNLSLIGGEILGGTLTTSGTARIVVSNNSVSNILSGVQISGNALDMSAGNAGLQLTNSTNFAALSTFTVGGNSYLRVPEAVTLTNLNLTLTGNGSSLQLYGGNAVTLASTVTVTGAGTGNNNVGISNDYSDNGTNALTNQGTLQATAANTSLNINPTGVFTNAVGGVVQATNGGTVTIATPNWVNNGTYVVNAGTLNLTAGFATAGIGTITRTGGTISLQAILTNTSAALDVQVFGGNLSLSSGEILGGTLTSSGTARIVANNGGANTLSNVQINGNALDLSAGTATLQLTNSTNFTALSTFTVGGNSYLRVAEAITLNNLNLTLSGSSSSLQLYGGNAVTLASTVMVTGAGTGNNNVGISNDYGDNGTNALTNQGTLQATAANTSLNINPTGVFTNAVGGVVQATNGGTVTIATTNWVNNGSYVVNAGTLNLTAGFATAGIGTITRTGGTISLQAILTNTSAALDVQVFGGNLSLSSGEILGGTLTSSGTARIVANNGGANTLSNVQINGNALDLSAGTATLQLTNSTNFTALSTFTVGGNSYLRVAEAITLNNLNLTLSGELLVVATLRR